MLPLNKAQRVLLADTLTEIGNLGAAAMVFDLSATIRF
jgi:hypothetical protein